MMEKTQISEIQKEMQKEYNRIDKKWLNLHFRTSAVLFIFSFFVECLLGYMMCNSDQLNTSIPVFIFKFIILPCILNFTCILIDYLVICSEKVSQEKKVYIVSILFVVICFVVFTVHIAFSALYFIFAIPILLTIIYAKYRLTVVIFLLCVVSVTISELFIKWDADKVSIYESTIRLGNFMISLFILCAFFAVSMVLIRFEREKNAAGIQKEIERYHLQQKLQTDELTGIYNRRALHDTIKEMEADETESIYIFAMIDIDNFKTLNDTHGHLVGDHCLSQFGRLLKINCRDAIPFRYGGDEFCILFRNYAMEDAAKICEQIKNELQSVTLADDIKLSLTASFGISDYSKNMDMTRLIANADQALYAAKAVKNTICIYQKPKKDMN
ncbi:MAG: GGDEF domain-containing protein [Anaerocolumna sp.]